MIIMCCIYAICQMDDQAFDQLRTKEQLGYIVFTGIKKVLHLRLLKLIGHRYYILYMDTILIH